MYLVASSNSLPSDDVYVVKMMFIIPLTPLFNQGYGMKEMATQITVSIGDNFFEKL